GRDARQRGRDDLITRADLEREQRDVERRGSGVGGHGVLHATEAGEGRLERSDFGTLSEPAPFDDRADRLELGVADVRASHRDAPRHRYGSSASVSALATRSIWLRSRPSPEGRFRPRPPRSSATARRSRRSYGGSKCTGWKQGRVSTPRSWRRARTSSRETRASARRTEHIQNTLFAHGASGCMTIRPAAARGASSSAYQAPSRRFFSRKPGSFFTCATPIAAWRFVIR